MTGAGKRLSELLAGIASVDGARDCSVHDIASDSRALKPGSLFLALPGQRHDGRVFLADAVVRGAAAIAYDSQDFEPGPLPIPAVGIENLAQYIGAIADRFFEAPSGRLIVIGVTGTNGKTTCTQLLAQALDDTSRISEPNPPLRPYEREASRGALGARRCAIIGTLGYGLVGALNESMHTTPDAITVHRLMREFLHARARYVSMEVSSHALHQGRVNGVAFDVALFTNLTRDHLDYHGDMQAYGAAKASLFDWDTLKHAVINHDDDFGQTLLQKLRGRVAVVSYGINGGDVRARSVTPTPTGLVLDVSTPQGEARLEAPLFGRFNAYNLLAVLATLLVLEVPLADAVERLRHARPVAGRAERFGGRNRQPLAIVDYAHTPDALEKILASLREHTHGRLVCVFGCGGDRDRGKRPQMGAIAERLADVVLLTDDNPRREAGDAIIQDIIAGMRVPPRVMRDRRAAIAQALAEATTGDVVLIAGKGHEDYQQVGDVRHPYSDRETVRALMGVAA